MLGIVGYVRALIKLAMGSEACVSAAFPTAPVRALLGVPDERKGLISRSLFLEWRAQNAAPHHFGLEVIDQILLPSALSSIRQMLVK